MSFKNIFGIATATAIGIYFITPAGIFISGLSGVAVIGYNVSKKFQRKEG